MTAAVITAAVCLAYAVFGVVVIRAAEAERLSPRWWRRTVAALRRAARTVRTLLGRAAARMRLRLALLHAHTTRRSSARKATTHA